MAILGVLNSSERICDMVAGAVVESNHNLQATLWLSGQSEVRDLGARGQMRARYHFEGAEKC